MEVDATSSTQYLHYQDFQSGSKDQDDVAEYFRLSLTKIDPAGKISVRGYGRLVGQLTTSNESRPELVSNVVGRLYYLYLDYHDVIQDRLDLRLGRSFVSVAADPATIDGGYLNLKNLGPAGVTLFGGRRVVFDNKSELDGSDSVWGGSVYLDTVKYTHVEASYSRRYADSELAQEYAALDVSSTPFSMLGLVGRARYDFASMRWAELLVGADLTPIADLTLHGEYYNSKPTFDQFSFYRFFNVDRYQQYSVAAEYRFNPRYSLNARYAYEDFNGNSSANLVDAGVHLAPIENLTVNASYEWRDGYAGRISGLRFSGGYRLQKALLQAGADFDDFRREDSRDGTAKKYWAAVSYDVCKAVSASLRAENNLNFYFSHAFRGFLAVNVHL
ncbi:hypothetical protein [Anaeromyxobacter paludicola]|uniref:hypothetical protein n=1 Tax=Anaeromyxobacter paludicola TaxID=2918171 RepID=UPI0020C0A73F|nr:hypothetical protein [Anaeromyxobacter paludicola]